MINHNASICIYENNQIHTFKIPYDEENLNLKDGP